MKAMTPEERNERNARNRAVYHANLEGRRAHYREYRRQWRAKHPERAREQNKLYYDPERNKAGCKRYRDADPERAYWQRRKWLDNNPEKAREKARRWHENNPGRG
jgi:hypothetical protein